MNITLAEDDIRVKFPAYGLTLRNQLTTGRMLYMKDEKVIKTELYINGITIDEEEMLFIWGRASIFPITLYPFDQIIDTAKICFNRNRY